MSEMGQLGEENGDVRPFRDYPRDYLVNIIGVQDIDSRNDPVSPTIYSFKSNLGEVWLGVERAEEDLFKVIDVTRNEGGYHA